MYRINKTTLLSITETCCRDVIKQRSRQLQTPNVNANFSTTVCLSLSPF